MLPGAAFQSQSPEEAFHNRKTPVDTGQSSTRPIFPEIRSDSKGGTHTAVPIDLMCVNKPSWRRKSLTVKAEAIVYFFSMSMTFRFIIIDTIVKLFIVPEMDFELVHCSVNHVFGIGQLGGEHSSVDDFSG